MGVEVRAEGESATGEPILHHGQDRPAHQQREGGHTLHVNETRGDCIANFHVGGFGDLCQ